MRHASRKMEDQPGIEERFADSFAACDLPGSPSLFAILLALR